MVTIRVMCRSCGEETIFKDGTPDNQHIIKTSSGPDKYRCDSCGNTTDCGMEEPFEIQ